MKKKFFLAFLLTLPLACSLPNNNLQSTKKTGEASLSFKFPNKSTFNIKKIPDNTEYIEVTISGVGISNSTPIKKILKKSDADKDGNAKLLIKEVPLGEKNIKIEAFDSSKKLLASGNDKISINSDKLNRVIIELKEEVIITPITEKPTLDVSPEPTSTSSEKPSPTNTQTPILEQPPVSIENNPNPANTQNMIKDKLSIKLKGFVSNNYKVVLKLNDSSGKETIRTANSNTLDFDDIYSGTTLVKAIVISDGIPIAKIDKEIELDKSNRNQELTMDSIEVFNDFESDILSVELDINKKLKSLFANKLISTPSNPPIIFRKDHVEIKAGGTALIDSNKKFQVNDSTTLNLKVSSPDQRVLSYVWAVTKLDTKINKYVTKIMGERGDNITVPLEKDLKYISFIATDSMTYSNMIIIPIQQFTEQVAN